MTQNKDQMRAEFEDRQFRDISTDAEQRERNGHGYRYMGVDDDWDTWQAAWQAARAIAPQGVPEAVIRETCKNYQGTAWGMIAECICDEIILAAAPQPVAQKGQA